MKAIIKRRPIRLSDACRLLLLLILPCFLQARPALCQFNGNFDIERHFIEIENFLDWKAYQPPMSWKYEWYFAPNRFRMSVGSIDMDRFYSDQDIRLEMDIGRYFTILYQQQQESLWGEQPVYREAELRFGRDIYASIVGFPEHEKKNSHSGYAIAYGKRHGPAYAHLSYLEQYLVYNVKNANTDKNADDTEFNRIPVLIRFDGQLFWEESLFVNVNIRLEQPTEFQVDNPLRIRQYEGGDWKAVVDWINGNEWLAGISARAKVEIRHDAPSSPSQNEPDLEQELSYRWVDVYTSFRFRGRDRLTFGLLDSYFENDIDSSFAVHRYLCRLSTQQIYGTLEHYRGDWFRWLFSLQAGQAILDKAFIGTDEDPEAKSWELKAGIGFIMAEKEHYRFFFNTTWDLDIFDTRQWDGGNVQVQYFF